MAEGILRHKTDDGWEILVGKNSRANDYLITRIAFAQDLWLHVRGHPGPHTVVRNPRRKTEMPPSVIHKAALLAAFNSKGRAGGKATVDYALRKHVKKPKGAPPGVITIRNPRTIAVKLQEK